MALLRTVLILTIITAGTAPAVTFFNGAYTLDGDDPTLGWRLNRDGIASDWGAPKTFGGNFASGAFPYQLFSFNSGSDPFIQVTFTGLDGDGGNLQAALYSTVFDPDDRAVGWLADGGLSTGTPPNVETFRYDGAPNTTYQVLLFDVNGTLSTGGLCVEGFATALSPRPGPCSINFSNTLTPAGMNNVPEPGTVWLLSLGLVPLVARRVRRRNKRD